MTKEWSKRVLARNLKRYMQESVKSQKEMAEVISIIASVEKYPF